MDDDQFSAKSDSDLVLVIYFKADVKVVVVLLVPFKSGQQVLLGVEQTILLYLPSVELPYLFLFRSVVDYSEEPISLRVVCSSVEAIVPEHSN